ncbi:hypothetical protein [Nocardia sp. alder85J]|uniref:hypothetical protein n=1 Tax=Nocardia sp. alder85J TaxID=2862949 RepID=UPI001CD20A4E|nr:hypothetical protein [Nocardia sp. alder85J]MCX4093608.1 hypothetical protein [Nocardia sp. alder85J]
MLRVYLDQAKWIDLTKCRVGHRQGKRFQDVYDIASEAVSRGHVSFVLSCAHYYETQRRTKTKSRLDLGATMARFSRFHSIAPPHLIVPAEIRQYLTGQNLTAQVALFGVGMKHAFNTTIDLTTAPAATLAMFPPERHAEVKAAYAKNMEFVLLAAPPMPNSAHERMLETVSMLHDGAQKFVDGQTAIADDIVTHKLRSRLTDVSASSEIADFLPPLIEGCQRHGVDLDELLSDRESIRALLRSLPSRWVSSELRRVRLRNPGTAMDEERPQRHTRIVDSRSLLRHRCHRTAMGSPYQRTWPGPAVRHHRAARPHRPHRSTRQRLRCRALNGRRLVRAAQERRHRCDCGRRTDRGLGAGAGW